MSVNFSKAALAHHSAGKKVLELLVLTLETAETVAEGWLEDHQPGCECKHCDWHQDDNGDQRTTVESAMHAARLAVMALRCELHPEELTGETVEDDYRQLAELAADAWEDSEQASAIEMERAYWARRAEKDPSIDTSGPECDPLRATVARLAGAVYPYPFERASLVVHFGGPGTPTAVLSVEPVRPAAGVLVAELAEDVRRAILALYPNAESAGLLFGDNFHGSFPVRLETPADTPALVGAAD